MSTWNEKPSFKTVPRLRLFMKELASGAEAIIFLKENKGSVSVVKDRVPKRYRHPELDAELRRSRTRREANIIGKVPVPKPRVLDTDREAIIEMEFIDGTQLKQLLDTNIAWAQTVGEQLAELHDHNIIHGDLTTSNMIVRGDELVFIDFGLSFTSHDAEDKAVDIHLFKQALESKHYKIYDKAYRAFLKGYRTSKNATAILDRLQVVERRGRNKAKY